MEKATKTAKLSMRAQDVLAAAASDEESEKSDVIWHPEYGAWMIESTPGTPYGGCTNDLHRVESNMRARRLLLRKHLRPGEALLSVVAFPTMGVGVFTEPALPPSGPVARSLYFTDSAICPHPRFGTLTRNIRTRRGRKVSTQLPLFRDAHTSDAVVHAAGAEGAVDRWLALQRRALAAKTEGGAVAEQMDEVGHPLPAPAAASEAELAALAEELRALAPLPSEVRPGTVYMDAMGYGMGACCLQVTFQARDLSESRRLYDQLAVLSPIMLALTAAAPIWRGFLVDTDVRWHVIESACDDRTPAERGAEDPLHADRRPQPSAALVDMTPEEVAAAPRVAGGSGGVGCAPMRKSRYASIDQYLSDAAEAKAEYNDIPMEVHEPSLKRLMEAGLDETLARHVAHLFMRDPLVIFRERVKLDDAARSDHWENFQSTNWQNVRWKPPPPPAPPAAPTAEAEGDEETKGEARPSPPGPACDEPAPGVGWRVELRTMEVQFTDFENAAFTVFVALVNRVLLFFGLNLYMPISLVDENMKRAHARDAIATQRFYFRRHVVPLEEHCGPGEAKREADEPDAVDEITVEEVLMGTGNSNPGLVPLVFAYLDLIDCDAPTRLLVDSYLSFIVQRARGELLTPAAWIRRVVAEHPDYKGDSVVTPAIAYDLLQRIQDVAEGRCHEPSLLGSTIVAPLEATAAKREHGGTHTPRRLRGGSFSLEALSGPGCDAIRSLVERYALRKDFSSTPAFLRGALGE